MSEHENAFFVPYVVNRLENGSRTWYVTMRTGNNEHLRLSENYLTSQHASDHLVRIQEEMAMLWVIQNADTVQKNNPKKSENFTDTRSMSMLPFISTSEFLTEKGVENWKNTSNHQAMVIEHLKMKYPEWIFKEMFDYTNEKKQYRAELTKDDESVIVKVWVEENEICHSTN